MRIQGARLALDRPGETGAGPVAKGLDRALLPTAPANSCSGLAHQLEEAAVPVLLAALHSVRADTADSAGSEVAHLVANSFPMAFHFGQEAFQNSVGLVGPVVQLEGHLVASWFATANQLVQEALADSVGSVVSIEGHLVANSFVPAEDPQSPVPTLDLPVARIRTEEVPRIPVGYRPFGSIQSFQRSYSRHFADLRIKILNSYLKSHYYIFFESLNLK